MPQRLHLHPSNQRPTMIDVEVLQSLNTSGALVLDIDPVSRILELAKRCNSRERPAVVISRNCSLVKLCQHSQCHVLSFHISGSSFTILHRNSADSGRIDSILMSSQVNVCFPSSLICVDVHLKARTHHNIYVCSSDQTVFLSLSIFFKECAV